MKEKKPFKCVKLEYQTVLENLFEPFALHQVIRDEKGKAVNVRFLDVNPAYEQVMGHKRSAVIGRTFDKIWPNPEDVWMDNMLQAAENGKHIHFEGYSREADRYLHSMAFPVPPDKVGVLFLDITNWRQSEEALDQSKTRLLQYREELRRLVTKLSLAEEQVRRQIATEIHDDLGSSHVSVLNNLKQIRANLPERARVDKVDETISMMQRIILKARKLTFHISSPILYEVGLGAALKHLGDNLFAEQGILFHYRGKLSDQEIDNNVTILLYQIVKELFVNVLKHAGASKVTVNLRRGPEKVTVIVEDDGVGFSEPFRKRNEDDNHFGLFSIRERLNYIGGSIQVLSEPGKGSTIYISTPANTKDLEEMKVVF